MRNRIANNGSTSATGARQVAIDAPSVVNSVSRDVVSAAFEKVGVRMQLRQNHRIEPAAEGSEVFYAVTSGVMLIEAGGRGTPHIVLGLLYPGDVYRSAFLPPLPLGRLTALARCDVLRAKSAAIFSDAACSRDVTAGLLDRIGQLQARLALHAASLATLSGDERVASFLFEVMLRLGQQRGSAVACDVPLSRKDMAAYLALNADTLSRIMSRLKTAGLVTSVGRSRLIASDIGRLKEMSPIGDAVAAIHSV